MQKFSAHLANWYSVMESAANVDLDDSEPGPWPNLRTMFQYKGKTENSVKFSCLFCVPKKDCFGVFKFTVQSSEARRDK